MAKLPALIIGGTSGLGLELAHLLSSEQNVFITGRSDPKIDKLSFKKLDLSSSNLQNDLDNLIDELPNIDILIYAAGFFQEGKIDDLSDEDIKKMVDVGLLTPSLLIQRVLKKQKELNNLALITSTSHWTPRLLEPIYTAVKSGLGMLGNSLSMDDRIKKVLVAGPAGMKTPFWEQSPRDMNDYLEPGWVAQQILENLDDDYKYRFIKIMRNPPRVEKAEER